MIKPFDYQEELIAGCITSWQAGNRRIAAVMSTGGGKTIVFSHVAKMSADVGRPVLVLAHRAELLDQAIDKLQQINPGMQIGRLDADSKQYRAPIVVASVATAATKTTLPLLQRRQWGLIIVDETHHVAADTYQRVLKALGAFDTDGPLMLGVTATLKRADRRSLGETFEAVVEPQFGLLELIKRGRLVRPRGIRVKISELDLSKVRAVAGDLNQGQLGAAMSAAMAPQRLVEAWTEHAKGRPTIAFMPTVAVSREVVEAFAGAGVKAVHIDDSTPKKRRSALIDDFREGHIELISNVGLFTEGTDLPMCECVILKMTSSETLYQQMIGRGLRLHPGKKDCVILDPTGVTGRHKLMTLKSLAGADSPEDIPDDLLMYEEDLIEEEIDEAEKDEGVVKPEYADGQLDHELIDLFGESHSAWLRTDGGLWFLPAPTGFIYLRPQAHDRYDLCWAAGHSNQAGAKHGMLQEGMQIEYAMAAGDQYVAEQPFWQMTKDAAWRQNEQRAARYDASARRRASALLDGLV